MRRIIAFILAVLLPIVASAQTSINGSYLAAGRMWQFSTGTSTDINATGLKCGAVYMMPKAGTISHIGFSSARSGVSCNYIGRLETVSSFLPSGSLIAAGATTATWSDSTGGGVWYKKAISTPPTVAKDDLVAVVIQYDSGTATDVFFGTYINSGAGTYPMSMPYAVTHNGTSWSQIRLPPMITLYYNDGTIVRGGFPCVGVSSQAFNSGSTPDEYAATMVAPFNGAISGASAFLLMASSSSATMTLYNSGGSALATCTRTAAQLGTSSGMVDFDFDTSVSIVSGGTYRLSIKADNANNITIMSATWGTTTERNAGYGVISSSTRTDAGAWTDASLTTYAIYPMVSSISAGGMSRARSVNSN